MIFNQSFPNTRLRRNRQFPWLRDLLSENNLQPKDLILPIFIVEGQKQQQKIDNLPDIYRYSIDNAIEIIKQARDLGIKAIMLFPKIDEKLKSKNGKEAINPNNFTCQAISQIKQAVPDIGIISDVALDPYTTHGHDGLVDKNDNVLNDETVEVLCQQSLVQVKAGCDIVAPSDMMDGRIGTIRKYLDANQKQNAEIMAYSAKFASNFYGPFRNAVSSNKNNPNIDKKTYQMDFRNSKEALQEIALDISEGADSIIVKPAMAYLDIIKEASQNFTTPIISYQVSGEYAMLKTAGNLGILDYQQAMFESLIAQKRAGASAIICYDAINIAKTTDDSF